MPTLVEVLQKKSAELNLFSAGDRLKLADKHIPDALAVLDFWEPGARVADIGTGGGLPGLALAGERPDLEFTLVDSTAKKIEAIMDMAEELDLRNVQGLIGRFEDLAHERKWREQFDTVTARAVAELPVLLEYVAGFLKVGGRFYAWKADYMPELKASETAQELLGLEFMRAHEYTLPTGENRAILEFKKTASLSQEYPRENGLPKAKPLL
jgi:16S rRNA (guanine527-N7)-methyltransferase